MGYKIASEMSSRTLDREVEKVAQVYRRKLCSNTPSSTPSSGPSPSSSISTRDDDSSLDDLSKDGKPSAKEGKDEVDREAVQREESIEDMTGALTQAEVESAMSVVRILVVIVIVVWHCSCCVCLKACLLLVFGEIRKLSEQVKLVIVVLINTAPSFVER